MHGWFMMGGNELDLEHEGCWFKGWDDERVHAW